MSNVNVTTLNPDTKTDMFSINKNANTPDDRRLALDTLLAGVWDEIDIGRLERVDTASTHAWKMWQWQPDDGK